MTETEVLRGEAIAKLYTVWNSKAEYERQLRSLDELETIAESITTHFSQTPRAIGNSKKDDTWAALADQRSIVKDDLDFYLDAKAELEEELMGLIRKPNIRTAMLYRFINCMSYDAIAEALGYDVRNVYYLVQAGRKIYISWYVKTRTVNENE